MIIYHIFLFNINIINSIIEKIYNKFFRELNDQNILSVNGINFYFTINYDKLLWFILFN